MTIYGHMNKNFTYSCIKMLIAQLQVANLLARAPQAHMASERGLTWHTPTPPPHLYHVPAPSPPDPLQVRHIPLFNLGSA